jgi:hypothetical protein
MMTSILILIALCVGAAVGFFIFAILQVSHTADQVPQRMPQGELPMEL